MHYRPDDIGRFLDFIDDSYNPKVKSGVFSSRREKALLFKVESKRIDGSQAFARRFFVTYDGKSHIRIGKTQSRLVHAVEDPQRDALLKKRNRLNSLLAPGSVSPEAMKGDPAAMRMYQQMMAFHKRLSSDEFREPRYVIVEPDRARFEQMFLGSQPNYHDFDLHYRKIMTNMFLPRLKSVFPDPHLPWWDIASRTIGGSHFYVFETFDYAQGQRKPFRRFILSHVEDTRTMSMVYGLDTANKVSFLFGFYRDGHGEGKLGSVNDRLLFPEAVVARFNEMEMEKSARPEELGQAGQVNKSFRY